MKGRPSPWYGRRSSTRVRCARRPTGSTFTGAFTTGLSAGWSNWLPTCGWATRSIHGRRLVRCAAIGVAPRCSSSWQQRRQAGGARVLAGGAIPDGSSGFYLQPTVVIDVDHDMELMREETFGPVLPVMVFDDDDEAFSLAADTPYGLGASCYTHTPDRVRRAYEELAVGTVWVNDPVVDNLAAPFGGMW